MTTDERCATLTALWRAMRGLVPARLQDAFTDLQIAIEATYNDHGDVRVAEAYERGQKAAADTLEQVRQSAYQAGMIAVQKRSDCRELDDIKDPEELRQTH